MASKPNPFYIEIVPIKEEYINKYGETKSVDLPLVTLPAGTVLFRGLKIPNLEAGEDVRYFYRDFLGNPDGTDMVCLEPTHNVFFYPFPYIAFGTHTIGPNFTMMQAVVLVQSVTVVCAIGPANMVRGQANMYDGTAPFQRCSSLGTKYDCKKPVTKEEEDEILKTKSYDNCIHPEYAQRSGVRGWMALADLDSIKPSIKKLPSLKYALKKQVLEQAAKEEGVNVTQLSESSYEKAMESLKKKYTAAMSHMGKYIIGLEQRQPGLGTEALTWMYTDNNKKIGFPEIALYPYKRHYGPKLIRQVCRNQTHALAILEKQAAFDNLNYLPLAAFTKDGTVDMINGHFSYECLGVSKNTFAIPARDQQSQIETRIREWMDFAQTKGLNLPFYGLGKLSFDMRTGYYILPQLIPKQIRIPMVYKDAKGRNSAPYSFFILPLDTEEAKYRALTYMLLFRTYMPAQAMKMFGLLPKFGVPRAMIFNRPPVLKWIYDELKIGMPETYTSILRRAAAQYKANIADKDAEEKVKKALIANVVSYGEEPFFILYKKNGEIAKQFSFAEWMSFTPLEYQKLLKAVDREPSVEEKKERIYKDNSAPSRVKDRRDFFFKGAIPNANLPKIHVDDTALFSITEASVADEQTTVIAKTLNDMGINPDEAFITDGTANVGGNTISFGKVFEKINSVEIGPLRAPLLANNIIVANLQNKVVVHCADYLEIWKNLQQDVIFMDPPWGGKSYKEKAILDLFLGNINVIDLIIQMISLKAASVVAMKAPTNYNIKGLTDSIIGSTNVKNESIQVLPMKKQLLIVIHIEGAKRPEKPKVIENLKLGELTPPLYGAVTPPFAPSTPPFAPSTPLYGAVTPPLAAAGGGGEKTLTAGGARRKTRTNRRLKRKTRKHLHKNNPIEYAKQFASVWKIHAHSKRKENIE